MGDNGEHTHEEVAEEVAEEAREAVEEAVSDAVTEQHQQDTQPLDLNRLIELHQANGERLADIGSRLNALDERTMGLDQWRSETDSRLSGMESTFQQNLAEISASLTNLREMAASSPEPPMESETHLEVETVTVPQSSDGSDEPGQRLKQTNGHRARLFRSRSRS